MRHTSHPRIQHAGDAVLSHWLNWAGMNTPQAAHWWAQLCGMLLLDFLFREKYNDESRTTKNNTKQCKTKNSNQLPTTLYQDKRRNFTESLPGVSETCPFGYFQYLRDHEEWPLADSVCAALTARAWPLIGHRRSCYSRSGEGKPVSSPWDSSE